MNPQLNAGERMLYTKRIADLHDRFARFYDRKVTELGGKALGNFLKGVDASLIVARATSADNEAEIDKLEKQL